MQRLQNKVVIVAGGATGIGAACAKRYIAEGAKVAIGDLNIKIAQELAASLGPNALAVRYDAADYHGVYASLARNTNSFASNPARAVVSFFKDKAAGIKKP